MSSSAITICATGSRLVPPHAPGTCDPGRRSAAVRAHRNRHGPRSRRSDWPMSSADITAPSISDGQQLLLRDSAGARLAGLSRTSAPSDWQRCRFELFDWMAAANGIRRHIPNMAATPHSQAFADSVDRRRDHLRLDRQQYTILPAQHLQSGRDHIRRRRPRRAGVEGDRHTRAMAGTARTSRCIQKNVRCHIPRRCPHRVRPTVRRTFPDSGCDAAPRATRRCGGGRYHGGTRS